MTTLCWNCGARLNGQKCQMCGAMQTPEAGPPPPPPYSGPAGQPVVRQASMSVRPPSSAPFYESNGQPGYDRPGGQPDRGSYSPYGPSQQAGMPGGGYYQQPGYGNQPYQMPGERRYVPGGQPQDVPPVQMMGPQQYGPAMGLQPYGPAMGPAMQAQSSRAEALSVPLGVVGGLVGSVIGAIIWAFVLDLTHINFWYLGFALGFFVGFGVALGAGGHNDIGLSLFAGALGLFSFFLALYFRLSLEESHLLSENANLFALSFNDFPDVLGEYLKLNPFNYINFVLVPLVAAGAAYRYINRGRR